MSNAVDLVIASEAIKQVENLVAKLMLADAELLKVSQSALNASKNIASIKTPGGLDKSVTDNQALNKKLSEQEEAIKKLTLQISKLTKARQNSNTRSSEEIVNQRLLARNADTLTRSTSALAGAYGRLSAEQSIASKRYQDLIVRGKTASQTQRQYNAELKTAKKDFEALNKRVLSADAAVGRFNRNVGNYPKQAIAGIGNLLRAFGVVGGVMLFASVVKDAFNTIKDFDKASADLAATLGTSRQGIKSLTDNAKELGATTKFTAIEIVGLQKELGKLGFSQPEILASTTAISTLASAVDTDLANAAMVAGQTLRAFNLEAFQMQRVVDVMAKSFTSSALDIEKFRESMKYVAPIANASNISIEQTTALLGILADNGIKGSMAGTSLRRIFTDLTKTGKPFNEALKEVAKNGISVKDAMDEVGRNAQTTLIVLGKNIPKIEALSGALDKAGGAAQKMADEQLNSLQGQITLMSSAFDGLVLSLNNGEGKLSGFFTGTVQIITGALNALTQFNATFADLRNMASGASLKADTQIYVGLDPKRTKAIAEENKKIAQEEVIAQNTKLREAKAVFDKLNELSLRNFTKRRREGRTQAKQDIEDANIALGVQRGRIQAADAALKSLVPSQKKITEATEEDTVALKNNTVAKRANVAGLELNAVSSEDSGPLESLKLLKKALEQTRDETSKNAAEFAVFNKSIEDVNQAIKTLTEPLTVDLNIKKPFEEANKEVQEMSGYLKTFVTEFAGNSGFSNTFELLSGDIENFGKDFATTFNALAEVAQESFNFIANASQNSFEGEKKRLQDQYDISVGFAGDNAAAKTKLAEDLEEKQKEIANREAKAKQRQALFNIAIDTAQAVVAALPNVPLAVAVGVLGAVQLALVASQKIPQYKDGTDNHGGGLMLVNDGAGSNFAEKVITPDGKEFTPQGRNVLLDAPKGTKVMTHEQQIHAMLNERGVSMDYSQNNSGMTAQEMDGIIGKHFAKIQTNTTNFDRRGFTQWTESNGNRTIRDAARTSRTGFKI
jgi:hypothetical protein